MSSSNDQPEQRGAHVPQVVVRAGKTFICTACGTMVEIPADVVGQFVIAVDHAPQQEPQPEHASSKDLPKAASIETDSKGSVAAAYHKPSSPPVLTKEPSAGHSINHSRPTRPRRPQPPKRKTFAGQIIDGLQVPTAQQLDRALAWVTFHLTVLDRQGSEFNRLRKLLKQRKKDQVPCEHPRENVKKATTQDQPDRDACAKQSHAHADVSMVPAKSPARRSNQAQERGPP